jgi:Uma2 family endonuclease
MTTTPDDRLLDYDDYVALSKDQRCEVLEGELIVMTPAPRLRHQSITLNIASTLLDYLQAGNKGYVYASPVDVVLASGRPGTIVQPDVVYLRDESHLTEFNIQGPPDLVVEVLSPSNPGMDTVRKLGIYERFGVPEYWIVPYELDQIQVLVLGPDGRYGRPQLFIRGDMLTSAQLPGFAVPVESLFPPQT